MIELTLSARKHLDRYLLDLRQSLSGCPSVDGAEVERDVIEHIERSLAGSSAPVDSPDLRDVLHQLGSPAKWIPEDELSWMRRLALRLRTGPDDFRLAFLSIAVLGMAGFLVCAGGGIVLAWLCLMLSFCFSRAVLAATSSPSELVGQKWLIYPALLLVYVPLATVLLFWAIPASAVLAIALHEAAQRDTSGLMSAARPLVSRASVWILGAYFVALGMALWWSLLALVAWRWPGMVRTVFYPFTTGFEGKRGLRIALVGVVIFIVGVAFGGWILRVG